MTRVSFSLWYIFLVILALPLFAGIFSFIDRSLIIVLSLFFSFLIVIYLYGNTFFQNKKILILSTISFILLIQFSKTALNFGVTEGAATFLRYLLYALFIIGITSRGISVSEFKKITYFSITICLFSIFIGYANSRYMFINDFYRFMGASHSPAALALQLSTNLFLIFAYFTFIRKRFSIFNAEDIFLLAAGLIIFISFLETGSRQPLGGIFLVLLFLLFIYNLKYFFLLLISALIYFFYAFDLSFFLDNRLISSAITIFSTDINEIGDIRDGSILSRINYLIVGINHTIENNFFFGSGLNSFPGIYLNETGVANVAPHNDFLLILVEFGVLGLISFLSLLLYFAMKLLINRNFFTISVLIFWFGGLSLNNSLYYHSVFMILILLFLIENNLNEGKKLDAI